MQCLANMAFSLLITPELVVVGILSSSKYLHLYCSSQLQSGNVHCQVRTDPLQHFSMDVRVACGLSLVPLFSVQAGELRIISSI